MLQKIIVYADGRTEPLVESKTAIILVQDGSVSVGRLVLEQDEWSFFHIDHPTNEEELNSIAEELIIRNNPECLKTEDAIILRCPTEIESQMIY